MPLSSKKFVIVSNQVNSYGYRYDTRGIDLTQYKKNPVLLHMHQRGNVIGHMQDIQLEANGDITGIPFFSDGKPLAMELYAQVEEGSINMLSSGVQPLDASDADEHLMPNQLLATVTKGKLKEVSIVDIGADDNALALYHDGEMLVLSDSTDLSKIIPIINQNKNSEMKEQLIPMLLLVGLSQDGTVQQLMQRITEMKNSNDDAINQLSVANDQIVTLNDTIGTLQQAAKDSELDAVLKGAVDARKITDAQIPFYKQMGNTSIDNLKKLFDTMPSLPTLESHVGAGGAGSDPLLKLTYDDAHKGGQLAEIKTKHPEFYKQIFKTKFGKEPQA